MSDEAITQAKIKWLTSKGYLTVQENDGTKRYFITDKGKTYLNDKEE